jgi:signal transduction histidine kinase
MWIKSIKDQTLALLVSLTLGVAVVFSVLAAVIAFVVEDSVISNILDEQATHIETHYMQHGNFPPMLSHYFDVYASIDVMPTWMQSTINPNRIEGEIFTSDESHYHYRKLVLHDGHNGYLVAEVSRFLVVTHQPRLWIIFLWVFFIVVAVSVILAIKFSKKIVNPILLLTQAVKNKEQSSNSVRLPSLPFELGYLSNTLQASFDKLNDSLEKEKAFTVNVSHELRTPLTVLKNSCVLIAQRGFTSEDLTQIKNYSEQMEHIVNVLLALARAEGLVLQPCNILIALEQAILQCHESRLKHIQINCNIPQYIAQPANSNLLQLLFINLLRNAAEHASEPIMTITYSANQLAFENKAQCLPDIDVTKAGIKSEKSEGIGQGLYLVARIAEHFGWRVAVDNSHQHFRVVIYFV